MEAALGNNDPLFAGSSRSKYATRTHMNPNVFSQIEWDRLIEIAQGEVKSEVGKALILDLYDPQKWAANVESARHLQQETQEVIPLIEREALWGPLMELSDPFTSLERLGKGSTLELSEWVTLRRWLYAMDSWIHVPREEILGEKLKKAIASLPDPYEPIRVLERILSPEGELLEKASSKLAALYQEIRSLKREIGSQLEQVLQNLSQKGYLQQDFTDVRDGRYVIPVKTSFQNEVEGLTYESSASRQTIFIEPKEIAPLTNRLRQRQNDLAQEIFIILEKTSKTLQPFAPEIERGVHLLAYWDTVQAKARMGLHYSGKTILVTEERHFSLRQTAHPLLWWSLEPAAIIRNDIEFGNPAQSLLLTGPNTGGKTVILKTLGLAGLCARTGFLFPAADHATVPFFDSFFADLGDSQSIQENLSSFSGHILKFKQILENMTEKSLVLIDELNSATDPEEGAAFGRAVLEAIMEKNAMIVTTTHDPHLKALALSNPQILNASMEFNEHAKTPTYKIVIGVPGRSRALETAERLGMPAAIIEAAKKYLSKEHLQFESMLGQLEKDTSDAAQSRRDANRLRDEAERMKKEWTDRTQASVTEMMERTKLRLRKILEQAQDEVRIFVRKLDESRSRKDIDQIRSNLNAAFGMAEQQLESALNEEAPEIAATLRSVDTLTQTKAENKKLAVGDKVRIPKWKNTGTISEVNGDKLRVFVGTLQITIGLSEVELVAGGRNPKSGGAGFTFSGGNSGDHIPEQLDLRGVRLEEAMSQLRYYLDQAYTQGGRSEVTIVHGLGTGAIREGTHQILKKLPYVKTFRDGGTGRGGSGATLVEFDRN